MSLGAFFTGEKQQQQQQPVIAITFKGLLKKPEN
jgi:hypothetical protein